MEELYLEVRGKKSRVGGGEGEESGGHCAEQQREK